jgi:hypothetical protein
MKFKHPELKDDLNMEKGPKGPKITDGDKFRTI